VERNISQNLWKGRITSETAKRIVCLHSECLRTTHMCSTARQHPTRSQRAERRGNSAHIPHASQRPRSWASWACFEFTPARGSRLELLQRPSKPHRRQPRLWGYYTHTQHCSQKHLVCAAIVRFVVSMNRQHDGVIACEQQAPQPSRRRASDSTTGLRIARRFFLQLWRGLTAYIMQCKSLKNTTHCARMQALRIQIDELH
jgi:hypothetical protein